MGRHSPRRRRPQSKGCDTNREDHAHQQHQQYNTPLPKPYMKQIKLHPSGCQQWSSQVCANKHGRSTACSVDFRAEVRSCFEARSASDTLPRGGRVVREEFEKSSYERARTLILICVVLYSMQPTCTTPTLLDRDWPTVDETTVAIE